MANNLGNQYAAGRLAVNGFFIDLATEVRCLPLKLR
jgi:hypothetical protein